MENSIVRHLKALLCLVKIILVYILFFLCEEFLPLNNVKINKDLMKVIFFHCSYRWGINSRKYHLPGEEDFMGGGIYFYTCLPFTPLSSIYNLSVFCLYLQ